MIKLATTELAALQDHRAGIAQPDNPENVLANFTCCEPFTLAWSEVQRDGWPACDECRRDASLTSAYRAPAGGGMTTWQVAYAAGITPSSARSAMTRERAAGRDCRLPEDLWPDRRTPLYDPAKIAAWLERRAGETRGRRSVG